MASRTSHPSESASVRMGPLALFSLVSVICLAVLAVLALSTAGATARLAQRRADATSQLYLQEEAAQTFVATLDAQLAEGFSPDEALASACTAAEAASGTTAAGQLTVTAQDAHPSYTASIDCGNGRLLEIALHYDTGGSLHVDQWRMRTVVNQEPPIGALLGSS